MSSLVYSQLILKMNEASFSRWLCQHLSKEHLFPQRLEVTTGAGIPDLAVLGFETSDTFWTAWIELKWNTTHIRPEQYIWGKKAESVGVNVNYIVGFERTLSLFSLDNAKKMAKSWKLVTEVITLPRTKESIRTLLTNLS